MLWLHLLDTSASTHVNESAVRAGSASNAPGTIKRTKYLSLTDRYQFEAVATDMAGIPSEGTKNIVRVKQQETSVRPFGSCKYWVTQYSVATRVAFFAVKVKGSVILEIKNLSKYEGRGFKGSSN